MRNRGQGGLEDDPHVLAYWAMYLFSVAVITDYWKVSSLEQHPFIVSQCSSAGSPA